jgi:hypothetical protein
LTYLSIDHNIQAEKEEEFKETLLLRSNLVLPRCQ